MRITLVMRVTKFMRGPTVVMPEAAARVTVVMVAVHGVMGRSRLLRKSDGASDRNHAHDKGSDYLRSQCHSLLPIGYRSPAARLFTVIAERGMNLPTRIISIPEQSWPTDDGRRG
jgi:hypothetical protein